MALLGEDIRCCEDFGSILASLMVENVKGEIEMDFNAWKAIVLNRVKGLAQSFQINPWYEILNMVHKDDVVDENLAAEIVSVISGKNRPRRIFLLNVWKEQLKFFPAMLDTSTINIKTLYQLLDVVLDHDEEMMEYIPSCWLDGTGNERSLAANDYIFVCFVRDVLARDIRVEATSAKLYNQNKKVCAVVASSEGPHFSPIESIDDFKKNENSQTIELSSQNKVIEDGFSVDGITTESVLPVVDHEHTKNEETIAHTNSNNEVEDALYSSNHVAQVQQSDKLDSKHKNLDEEDFEEVFEAVKPEIDANTELSLVATYAEPNKDVVKPLSEYEVLNTGFVVRVVQGNLLSQSTDAIVNAANARLVHGAGVAKAIEQAAGRVFTKECEEWIKQNGLVRVGEGVAVTTAGNIPRVKKVVHIVGPNCSGRDVTNRDCHVLQSAVTAALNACEAHNLRSVSFPAVSTGIYSFPLDLAAELMIDAAIQYRMDNVASKIKEVRFVLLNKESCESFQMALGCCAQSNRLGNYVKAPSIPTTTLKAATEGSSFSSSIAGTTTQESGITSSRVKNGDNLLKVEDVQEIKDFSKIPSSYAAGGIFMYRFAKGNLHILLGVEYRFQDRENVLNPLGGKKDFNDRTALNTAAREFAEESGHVISAPKIKALIENKGRCVWFGPGKYVLFLLPCPKEYYDIDKRYNRNRHRDFDAEMNSLMWVQWSDLLQLVRQNTSSSTKHKNIVSSIVEYVVRSYRCSRKYPLSEFLIRLLRSEVILQAIHQLSSLTTIQDLSIELSDELEKSKKKLSAVNDEDMNLREQSKSWNLKLNIPKFVPTFEPIKTLKPSEEEYKTVAAMLSPTHPNAQLGMAVPPQPFQTNVHSIRKVNVQSRISDFRNTEIQLQQNKKTGAEIEKLYPLFHGTPERWRATNIAFKGFDLGIVLNGRALGNGVYSALDISIPVGYVNGKGSVIVMEGLLQKGVDAENGQVRVFRNANQVLPRYLIDFANDSEDHVARSQAKEQEIDKHAKQVLEEKMKHIQREEKKFLEDYKKRHRKCLEYYDKKLTELQVSYELAKVEEDADRLLQLRRRFDNEFDQFHAENIPPIYSDKERVINTLQANDVIILTAATGSGKSTQIPQYLVDDVFPSTDLRRVAVLQPRRDNATSLCQRVSKERGSSEGKEVGYSLGMGDNNVSPATRIEYMTHGLFINRALNPEALIQQYSAVVVDEAHVRSNDVDLCLGLLRNALLHCKDQTLRTRDASDESGEEDKSTTPPFKVIVCSATIENAQLQQFQEYFSPLICPGVSSTLFHVEGNAFPVLVLHRPEAEPDWSAATLGIEAAKALAVYALEISIELIKSTNGDGNILVFLPGESVINHCMQAMAHWAQYTADNAATAAGDNSSEKGDDSSKETSQQRLGYDEIKVNVGTAKKPKYQTIGIYPFHGKINETAKQKMFNFTQDRIIIFSTNAAETGLTLPNIRYVIDTGLERRVTWNRKTSMQEMRTCQITKSSMKQRTGRAGRVASGICIRLFSEKTEEGLKDAPDPEVENGVIMRTVLTMKSLPNKLHLISEIPEESIAAAETTLKMYKAIDDEGKLTSIGEKLFKFGMNLRLGRFLIACNEYNCLAQGGEIAAIVSITNCSSLLPSRRENLKDYEYYRGLKFVDADGDFFTLANIFHAYRHTSDRSSFCVRHHFDQSVLEDAVRAFEHIEMLCVRLQLNWQEFEADENDGDWKKEREDDDSSVGAASTTSSLKSNLRKALCAAYCDQLIAANTPNKPSRKFVRLLSDKDQGKLQRATKEFLRSVGLLRVGKKINDPGEGCVSGTQDGDDDDGEEGGDDTCDFFADNTVQIDDDDTAATFANVDRGTSVTNNRDVKDEDCVRIPDQSTFWYLSLCANSKDNKKSPTATNNNSSQLAIFNSIMLTDSAIGGVVQLVNYVSEDDVKEGASTWSREINFSDVVRRQAPSKRTIQISPSLRKFLLDDKGKALKRHFTSNPQVFATIEKDNDGGRLEISAPPHLMRQLVSKLKNMEDTYFDKEYSIELTDLEREDVAKVIKNFGIVKKGNNNPTKEAFIDRMNAILSNLMGNSLDHLPLLQLNDIRIDSSEGKCYVITKLRGPIKQFASMIVGAVQSEISTILKKRSLKVINPPNNGDGTAGDGESRRKKGLFTPHLTALSTQVTPSYQRTRTSAMIYMAHAAIWKAGACVYGGFVRDCVVRGEAANDIDVGFYPSKISLQQLDTLLCKAAADIQLQVLSRRQKSPVAYTLIIGLSSSNDQFEIDLVDLNAVQNLTAPGVDCDVGNLMLAPPTQGQFAIQLKVNKPSLVTLAESLKHCQEKSFVFYYLGNEAAIVAQRRLTKYFQRGWTCLNNNFPPNLKAWVESSHHQQLVQPMQAYNKNYHS